MSEERGSTELDAAKAHLEQAQEHLSEADADEAARLAQEVENLKASHEAPDS